jgi:ribosomal protein S18 acetylase RimI-like enzyme
VELVAAASRNRGLIGSMRERLADSARLDGSEQRSTERLTGAKRSIVIREASTDDNAALLALTAVTPMLGAVSLRIDRGPDFFHLLKLRGEAKVLVATHRGRVIGCISATARTAFVNGSPKRIGYIGDVKVHPSFAGSRIVLRLISALREDLIRRDVDLLFAVIAAGNRQALSLMKGRLGTPRWQSIGSFRVYELLPSPFSRRSRLYEIGEGRSSERQSLASLVNRFNRAHQFGPVLDESPRGDDASDAGMPFGKTLVARVAGQVVASVTTFDTTDVKTNVVVGLPLSLKVALAALDPLRFFLPRFRAPSIGQPLRLLYLRHPAHAEGHELGLRELIQRARYEAYQGNYSFAVLGVHERDPLSVLVRGLPKFVFVSHAFATSLMKRHDLERIAAGIPMEDYSLV